MSTRAWQAPATRPVSTAPARHGFTQRLQRSWNITLRRVHAVRLDDGSGGSNLGGSGSGGSGGSGGDGGGNEPGDSSTPPQHLWWLVGVAAYCLGTEAYSVWQYRDMAARDACRRTELFPQQAAPAAAAAAATAAAPPAVSIIVPVLNEELGLQQTLEYLQKQLQPAAAEIVVVDGGSSDRTVQIAERCGVRVVRAGRGRARQMNAGAAVAAGDVLIFVHADSRPPVSLITEALGALSRPGVVLGGFRPIIENDGKPMLFFSANNTMKTYYGPLLLRPLSFLRGLRCLFGDQTLFCQAADFRAVGGYDSRLPIMEDADLCIRMHMAGRKCRPGRRGQVAQIVSVPTRTSGRRLASWGNLHATVVHVIIGMSWYFGASPEQLKQLYQRLYTDMYR